VRWSFTGTPDGMIFVMAGLVAYGAGLGLFIAPNNSAALAAAPTEHAGQAGGLLNLMRAFGTATGVASASALLAWRLERATGAHESTLAATARVAQRGGRRDAARSSLRHNCGNRVVAARQGSRSS